MSNHSVVVHEEQQNLSVFRNVDSFETAQRMATLLNNSTIVPENYRGQGNLGNALVALDLANRMALPPIMVMQNLYLIDGRPSWSSSFIISCLNSCGLFSPLRFETKDLGEETVEREYWAWENRERYKKTEKIKIHNKSYRAYAVEKSTGETIEGPEVSIAMAVKEGWYGKNGSKWQTMPDLMGRYRSAAFFGRIYAPHILNGLQTKDELQDAESLPQGAKAEDYEIEIVDEEKPSERPKGVDAALKTTKGKQKTAKTSENTKQKERSEETKQSSLHQTEGKAKKTNGRQRDTVTQQNYPEQTTSQKHPEDSASNGKNNVAESSSPRNEAVESTQNNNDDIFGFPDDDYNPE